MWNWIVEHQDNIVDSARAVIEIAVLWVVFYQLHRFFKATRGAQILMGLVLSLVGVSLFSYVFQLNVIAFLLTHVIGPVLVLSLVILFQPELRNGLAKLGANPFLSRFVKFKQEDEFLENFCKSVSQLSNKRYGALFAFEKRNSLKSIVETGVKMDARFSPELALTIFFPKTALHDGGAVIASDRIVSAGCVFPVSSREMNDRTLGLRHRAAVGLSDEADCVVVVVSEETGAIALSVGGKLERNLDIDTLRVRMQELLHYSSSDHEETDRQ